MTHPLLQELGEFEPLLDSTIPAAKFIFPERLPTRAITFEADAGCMWPLGEPGNKSFRFCGAEVLPKKPYCADHAAVAYLRPKKPSKRNSAEN